MKVVDDFVVRTCEAKKGLKDPLFLIVWKRYVVVKLLTLLSSPTTNDLIRGDAVTDWFCDLFVSESRFIDS